MFTVGSNVLAMQGHPEFSVEFEQYLLQGRKNILPPELYRIAEASLATPIDNATIAKWIVSFLF